MKTTLIRAFVALALFATLAIPAFGQFSGGGFSFTAGQIPGTSTNNNASAGNVGQYIEALQTTATNLGGNGVYTDMGSLALTAGDWDVSMNATFSANGASVTSVAIGLGTTVGNSAAGITFGSNGLQGVAPTASYNSSLTVASFRISLAASATYYCKGVSNYTVATVQMVGRCSARRVR